MRQVMLRFLFQNSRMALAFVVLTVLGAAAMIGSPDSGGLVTRAVSLSESQRGLLGGGPQGVVASPGQGQAKAAPSVFGDFDPQAPATASPGSADSGNPMTAPMASSAVVAPPGAAVSEPIIDESAAPE
jgi:hypothetical protein